MEIILENCKVKIKWMGTEEDWKIREYCYRKTKLVKNKDGQRHMGYSRSPNKNLLDNATTSMRYCLTCQEQRMFIHKGNAPHSVCQVCGQTHSSRGKLTTKINHALK
jgi:hypothetical protein